MSEAARCGASKKGLPEDSTLSTASGSQLFKHVPQIAAYHKKLLEVHLIDESLSLWLVTTEVLIKLHWVLVASLLQNLLAELG